MDAREVNLMLARASLLDARLKRSDPQELAAMVREWHALLGHLDAGVVERAVRDHYREESRALMPADVLRRVGPRRLSADDVARAAWLAARGLTERDLLGMPRAELEALVMKEVV